MKSTQICTGLPCISVDPGGDAVTFDRTVHPVAPLLVATTALQQKEKNGSDRSGTPLPVLLEDVAEYQHVLDM